MAKKISYIPTLQEYAKKRKKEKIIFTACSCEKCEFYRDQFKVCVFGENIRTIDSLKSCPVMIPIVKGKSLI